MSNLLESRVPTLGHPRLPLGDWPTPVEEITSRLEGTGHCAPEGVRLFCKREDLASRPYGGNKVRKLEYIIAKARAEGRRDLVTIGAVGSHHVLATAVYGQQHGLKTHAVLIPQPYSEHVRENARVTAHVAASIWPTGGSMGVPVATARAWLAVKQQTGRAPLFVPPGGSSPVGTLGHVSLGLEIAEDVRAGRLPAPRRVYAALGSGGTVAGLLVGLGMGGLDTELVAVRVVELWLASGWSARWLAWRTAALIPGRPARGRLRVIHDQLGAGYGHAVDVANGLIEPMQLAAGIHLEQTYTAKTLAGCLADLHTLSPGDTALYVHTVNSHPLTEILKGERPEIPEAAMRLMRPARPGPG